MNESNICQREDWGADKICSCPLGPQRTSVVPRPHPQPLRPSYFKEPENMETLSTIPAMRSQCFPEPCWLHPQRGKWWLWLAHSLRLQPTSESLHPSWVVPGCRSTTSSTRGSALLRTPRQEGCFSAPKVNHGEGRPV